MYKRQLKRYEVFSREAVEVSGIIQQAGLDESAHPFLAEGIDLQGVDPFQDVAIGFPGTLIARADQEFSIHGEGAAAARTVLRGRGLLPFAALDDPDDLGDDISPALHEDRVPDSQVKLGDGVDIVEGGVRDGHAGDLYRFEAGDRGDPGAKAEGPVYICLLYTSPSPRD